MSCNPGIIAKYINLHISYNVAEVRRTAPPPKGQGGQHEVLRWWWRWIKVNISYSIVESGTHHAEDI